jgi:outer membrane protein OmpA-like peptidoglycan-associated protein
MADEYELAAGLQYRFGVRTAPPPPPPRPAPRRVRREPVDRDDDGLTDDQDECPSKPEDVDEFADEDGCPDPDNDDDGVVDGVDKCPAEPEARNGYQDDDGCPDALIRELAGITFARDSDRILSESLPILHRAVEVLAGHPALHVEISGHTSDDGDHDHNVALSARRAEAVKAYLVAAGIAADRIRTAGHGPDKPIADNSTAVGRAENRRIEFRVVLEQPL